MSSTQLIAVVVEWTELAEVPELIVANDQEEATRKLVEHIATMDENLVGGLREWSGVGGADWHDQNPVPPARGSALPVLHEWLEQLHEYASRPAWTYYQIDLTPPAGPAVHERWNDNPVAWINTDTTHAHDWSDLR